MKLRTVLLAAAASPVAAVWPIPTNMTTGNSSLLISQTIAITYNGAPLVYTYGYEPTDVRSSQQLVQAGVSRALSAIFQNGLVPWKLKPRNTVASSFEPDLQQGPGWVRTLAITQTSVDTAKTFAPRVGDVDESYELAISAAGAATLTAATSTGVLRGLETFVQLFYQHTTGTSWYTPFVPVAIADAPKYGHRGVLLDVARNYFEPAHVYRTLDACAWNKLNRLHLHVTDSQSWPLELPSMPEVAAKGAYRSDLTYSAAEVDKMHRYAAARGVELVLEIDMPGHISSLWFSHPELVTAFDATPYTWYCAEPPCGALRLNDSAVDAFLERLFADVLPRVAPYAAYFHTGGDELKANDSVLDPGLQTNASSVLQPLLQKFVDAQHARVRAHGLSPMVWEEMALEWNVTLGSDTLVQTWLGASSVKQLVAKGLKVVDSNYNFWYLDCGRGQWMSWDRGAAFAAGYPFNDWCNPYKSWRLVYAHDPAAGLTEAEAQLVVGGEVALWSETADGLTLDSLLWPRASAAGEVLWSGNTDASGQNRSQVMVAPRLNEWRERMVQRGVAASSVQMVWCSQADPGECAMPGY